MNSGICVNLSVLMHVWVFSYLQLSFKKCFSLGYGYMWGVQYV